MAKQLYTNNASTKLSAALAAATTSFTVTAGEGALFATPASGDWQDVTLTDGVDVEIVKLTARSTDTFTVTRAQQGTAARDWLAGTKVEARLTAATMTGVETRLGGLEAGGVAVSTKTAGHTLALSDAGNYIRMSAAGALSLTVPLNADVGFAVGDRVTLRQAGAGQVTVVGDSLVTEPATWTSHGATFEPLDGFYVQMLTFLNGLFLLVGYDNPGTVRLYTSPDGMTWTLRHSAFASSGPQYAAYGAGAYVVDDGDARIWSSPDGVTWTERPITYAVNGYDPAGALIFANSLFVLGTTTGKIATSADGITWTERTSTFGSSAINATIYAAALFVMAGYDGKIATSPDAVTWTDRTSQFGTSVIYAVAYGGSQFVAGGAAGKISTSPDGLTWTAQTSQFTGAQSVMKIAHNGTNFVAAGGAAGASAAVSYSADGATWVLATTPFTDRVNTLSLYGTSFFAGGRAGKAGTSPDGITWTLRDVGFGTSEVKFSALGAGRMAVGGAGSDQVASAAAGGSSVVINTPETLKLKKQHATALLVKVGADEWDLSGELETAA